MCHRNMDMLQLLLPGRDPSMGPLLPDPAFVEGPLLKRHVSFECAHDAVLKRECPRTLSFTC